MLTMVAILAAVILAWTGVGVMTERGVKEPPFRVEQEADGYVIRHYEGMVVAAVDLPPGTEDPLGAGFRLLFRYIGGENRGVHKITMTAPVFEEQQGTSIPMTAPVLAEAGGEKVRIAFVLPAGSSLERAPQPTNPAVVLHEIPPRRLAVLRFSGYATPKRIEAHQTRLLSALARDGLVTRGNPTIAYYNPPWTPPFMRRNEVMIELADTAKSADSVHQE